MSTLSQTWKVSMHFMVSRFSASSLTQTHQKRLASLYIPMLAFSGYASCITSVGMYLVCDDSSTLVLSTFWHHHPYFTFQFYANLNLVDTTLYIYTSHCINWVYLQIKLVIHTCTIVGDATYLVLLIKNWHITLLPPAPWSLKVYGWWRIIMHGWSVCHSQLFLNH